ncbi:GAF domain-containing sensor histidine kinase [Macrococcus equipercicus]|uniref:histidine kinase n=1 Tax=Macrococcus equipercicus TaxID=69967 RepID=A0A9Q9BKN6_9STAP|nr:GAF domain-containing sensor histidine kinase [Macrococcus equipercicus]KAA1039177.1 GAF domain-containing sensor histidine kinase [Macrococcus equipercicus]UTH13353.1 GAF domain-containing sensor histidine kinase [Macrococcus equipercicus]
MKSRTALLKEIAEFLNEETETYSMLDGALKRLVEGTDFSTGWIFFIDDEGSHQLISDYRLPDALEQNDCHYMTAGPCWCVSRYHQGKLTKASNIITCSRIVKANRQHPDGTADITHHATVPLQSGQERFGLLNVAAPHKTSYSEDELELLESVAFQIGSAIKRIFLTEREREIALTNERNRLARDLHDSVNQMLFSLRLTAHAAAANTKDDRAKSAFEIIEATSQSAVNEMRALIWQLKPIGLEQGLAHAIHQYADVLNLNVTMHINGLIQLDNKEETVVFRIAQEALNNIKKHAGTAEVEITINQLTAFSLTIKDNGKGFAVQSAKQLPTHGLANMRQRAESIGGMLFITSSMDTGTVVTFTLQEG